MYKTLSHTNYHNTVSSAVNTVPCWGSIPLPRVSLFVAGLVTGLYLRQLEVAQQIPHGVQKVVDGVSEVSSATFSTSSPCSLHCGLCRGLWIEVGHQRPKEHSEGAGVVNGCRLSLWSRVGVDGVDGRERIPGQHGGVLQICGEMCQNFLVVIRDDNVTVNVPGQT